MNLKKHRKYVFVCVSIQRMSTCGPNLSFAQNTRPFLSLTEPIPPGPQNTCIN